MQLFNWLFRNKKLQKDIRKEEALKVYKEVRELIEIYHKQLLKGRSYSQDVCNGLRDLYLSQLNRELELYLEIPKQSIQFEDRDEIFNIVISKVSNQFNKVLRK